MCLPASFINNADHSAELSVSKNECITIMICVIHVLCTFQVYKHIHVVHTMHMYICTCIHLVTLSNINLFH